MCRLNLLVIGYLWCVVALYSSLGMSSLLAQTTADSAREKQELLERMQKLEQDNRELRQRVNVLEKQNGQVQPPEKGPAAKVPASTQEEIEAEVDRLLNATPEKPAGEKVATAESVTPTPLLSYSLGHGTSLQFVDISLDVLATAGTSTLRDSGIQMFEVGGHDPKRRGFTLQQIEMSAQGAVDPYVRGYIDLVYFLNTDNESQLEIEEGYLVTQTLPWGLQIKSGQFFTEFGRQNPIHPHAWDFVDQPVVLSRMFGPDGLRNPGIQASILLDLPWHSVVTTSMQNAAGGTAVSFLSHLTQEAGFGESFAGHTFVEREVRALRDLLYMAHWANTVEIIEGVTVQAGYSFLFGPNATGQKADTCIHAIDLFVKWRPRQTDHGFPFVAWQSEWVWRRYEAEAGNLPHEQLDDWGCYTQLTYGFIRSWVVAARYDFARGDSGYGARDFLSDERHRLSANVTYYPSEFFKLRLQYNVDKAQHLGSKWENSIWFQTEFLLGPHGAHNF